MFALYHPLRHTSGKTYDLTSIDVSQRACGPKIPSVSHCVNMFQSSSPLLQAFTAVWVLNLAARSYHRLRSGEKSLLGEDRQSPWQVLTSFKPRS